MLENIVKLYDETPEEIEPFVDFTDGQTSIPIPDAEVTASIATLAAKNLSQLTPEELKTKHGQYYDLALQREEDTIRGELVNLKFDRLLSLSDELIEDALLSNNSETIKDLTELQYSFDTETEKFTIMESAAADQIVSDGSQDEDRAIHSLNDLELDTQSYEDIVQETLTEQMLLAKTIKKYVNKLGWNLDTLGQVGQMFIPLAQMNALSQKIKTEDNPILAGYDIKEQVATFKAMSLPEKAKTLDRLQKFFDIEAGEGTLGNRLEGGGNNLAALTYFMYLQEYTGFDNFVENAIHVLDGTIVGMAVSKPVGAVLKGVGLANKIGSALLKGKIGAASIMAGNRASASEQILATQDAVRSGEITKDSSTAADAGELLLEGQLKPISDIVEGSPGVSGRVAKDIQIIEKTTQDILDTQQVRFLNVDEVEDVLSVYREQLASEMLDQGVHHVDILKPITDTVEQGLEGTKYTIMFGDAAGTGFSSAKTAMEYAELLKLDGATVTLKEVDGTHFLKLSKSISDQAGFVKPYKGIDDAALKIAGGWRRVLGSPTNFVGTLEARSAHLTLATREIGLNHATKLMKFVKGLNQKEKTNLAEVMEYGRNNSTWFNPQQLKDRWFLNDKQIVAYHALRRMDDFNHIILNSFEYSRKERLGFKTLTLTNPKAIQKGLDKSFDARVIDTIDNPSNKSIYNVTTGRYEKDLSVSRLQELKQQGYILTELEGARETDVLEPLNFLIGKVQDITVKPLKYNQVDYRAGGRVAYQEEYFVKQGRLRQREGNPVPILLKSKTYGVGTKEEAVEFANMMNKAMEIVLKNLGANGKAIYSDESSRLIDEATNGRFKNVNVFVDYVGQKNLGMKFEAVQDGQELTSVRQAIASGANAHPFDTQEINSIQRMIAINGGQTTKRGERLPDFNGNPSPVINPVESATKSLDNALRLMSIETWRQRQAVNFAQTFATVLKGKKSPMGHFLNPEYIDDANDELIPLIQRAKRIQQQKANVLNTRTGVEKWIQENAVNPLADIFMSVSKKIGRPLKNETVTNLKNKDPIGFIRSLSYNANLGLFNLRQPAIQAQATLLMMSASPKNGAKAAFLGGPMRLMLASENPQTLKAIAKGVGKVVGISGDEVMELHDILQKTGTWRLKAGALAEQELKGLSSGTTFQKFLDAGTVPFLETERYNKISATMAAAMNWREANPGVKITESIIDEIRSNSEFFTANMNRIDRADWQRGFASMPTQFWGYQARAIEMMLPEMLGGSKHFTGGQKLRMATTQLALYGVGGATAPRYGLRLRDTINEMYKEQFGEDAEIPKAMLDTIEKGMIESLFANALGVDVAFAHRAGLGLTSGGWGEVAAKIASLDLEEVLKIDAAGMSTLAKATAAGYNMLKLLNPSSEYFGTIEQLDAAIAVGTAGLRDTVSSYNNFERAYIAATLGMHVDKLGATTDRASTTMEVVLGILGLDPSNEAAKRAMKESLKGAFTFRKTTVKVLARELNLAIKSNNFDKFLASRKFLFSVLDEQERRGINKSILSKAKNTTKSIQMQYFKQTGIVKELYDKENESEETP